VGEQGEGERGPKAAVWARNAGYAWASGRGSWADSSAVPTPIAAAKSSSNRCASSSPQAMDRNSGSGKRAASNAKLRRSLPTSR